MEYLLYPGCRVQSSAPHLESSTKLMLKEFGISVQDEKEFSCCGANIIYSLQKNSGLSLIARNLSIAEKTNVDILTLCNWCYKTLNAANQHLKANVKLREEINSILADLGRGFKGSVKVKNIIQVLIEDIGIEKLKANITQPLHKLRVALFIGCQLKKYLDEKQDTSQISEYENIIKATGASIIDYEDKYTCCGGFISNFREIKTKSYMMDDLTKLDINALVVHCPYCYNRFESALNEESGEENRISILYLPELLGLAMGFDSKKLSLNEREQNLDKIIEIINE